MQFNMQSEMSILYVLMAVVIFLALMAAIGAWVRGGGLKREDAENLFTESQDRHREEISRLQKIVEEARQAAEQAQANAQQAQTRAAEAQSQTAQALKLKLQDIDTQVSRTRTDLESAVSRTAADQQQAIAGKLDVVTRHLGDSETRMTENVNSINGTLQSLHEQVSHAGDQMREALIEIARQQQDQKAQGTIQMCEALITSLGTLKTSIASQLTLDAYDDNSSKQMLEADSIPSDEETNQNRYPSGNDQPDETDQSGENDHSDWSDTSDMSDATTVHDNNTQNEPGQGTDTATQPDTSDWGDALQLPDEDSNGDDEENGGVNTGNDNNNDNSGDNGNDEDDNDDRYPPPIY